MESGQLTLDGQDGAAWCARMTIYVCTCSSPYKVQKGPTNQMENPLKREGGQGKGRRRTPLLPLLLICSCFPSLLIFPLSLFPCLSGRSSHYSVHSALHRSRMELSKSIERMFGFPEESYSKLMDALAEIDEGTKVIA